MIGAAVAVLIGGMLFFIGQADKLAPDAREVRVELPNAFKQ